MRRRLECLADKKPCPLHVANPGAPHLPVAICSRRRLQEAEEPQRTACRQPCHCPSSAACAAPRRRHHCPLSNTPPLPLPPCRVRAAEVCRSWREATLSPPLWSAIKVILPCDDDEGTAEAFVSWLLPRVGAVLSLHVDIQDSAVSRGF